MLFLVFLYFYGFFHILLGEYISNQEVVVVQTPEWKVKANIAAYATFKGH